MTFALGPEIIDPMKPLLLTAVALILPVPVFALDHLVVKATNPLPFARPAQTLELSRAEIGRAHV